MTLTRPPRPFRIGLFVLAAGAVLWGSLSPTEDLPSLSLWDKAEHAGAYLLLALLGAWAFRRRMRVAIGLVAFGIGVEFLQAWMDLGRQGDPLDALANTLGVAAGMALVRWTR